MAGGNGHRHHDGIFRDRVPEVSDNASMSGCGGGTGRDRRRRRDFPAGQDYPGRETGDWTAVDQIIAVEHYTAA